MLGEHRHQAEDERQLAVVAAGEVEAHGALAHRLGLVHLGVVAAQVGAAFVAQELPREDHVFGRNRRAVGEARGRVEVERDVAAPGVRLDRARHQPVQRERLIVAARHQALDHEAADRRHRDALDDQGTEAVEGAEDAHHQAPALGRGRIDIGEPGEARRHRRLAVHGEGALRLGRGRAGAAEASRGQYPTEDGRKDAAAGAAPASGRRAKGQAGLRRRAHGSDGRGRLSIGIGDEGGEVGTFGAHAKATGACYHQVSSQM